MIRKKESKSKPGPRACLKLKALEETRSFYQVELKKEEITEIERDKYLKASKLIDGFIKKEGNMQKGRGQERISL